MDSMVVEAWISLYSSNLLCTTFTFNKLALSKKLMLSPHSCRVQRFFSILFTAVYLVSKRVPGNKHL